MPFQHGMRCFIGKSQSNDHLVPVALFHARAVNLMYREKNPPPPPLFSPPPSRPMKPTTVLDCLLLQCHDNDR